MVEDTITLNYKTMQQSFRSYWVYSGNNKLSGNVGYQFGNPLIVLNGASPNFI
jgi:hypothetical protein